MSQIIPIKDLNNTAEISEMVHAAEEPIYVTKNARQLLGELKKRYEV